MDLIICFSVPVTVLHSMLGVANIVTDVMKNNKNTTLILDNNFMIALFVSYIIPWLPELAATLLIAIVEAICINAIMDWHISSIALPRCLMNVCQVKMLSQ